MSQNVKKKNPPKNLKENFKFLTKRKTVSNYVKYWMKGEKKKKKDPQNKNDDQFKKKKTK